jgi:hypothetical protein
MLKSNTFKRLFIAASFLFAVICAAAADSQNLSPGFEPVCFRHKERDTINTGCYKIQGKNEAFPHYECPDKSGTLTPFDPKNEWEVIDGNDSRCKPNTETLKKKDVIKSGESESEKEIHLFPGCASKKG